HAARAARSACDWLGSPLHVEAYCIGFGVRDAVLVYPEPMPSAPLRIQRDGVDVQVRTIGVDLTGRSREDFDVAVAELCARVRAIAGCVEVTAAG
ncbi:MAG TPA: hypothetical protein QGH10_25005, partial [Armatimonadota bacterium]|nr:hypothetical protein [Armatimonadota bacterium]